MSLVHPLARELKEEGSPCQPMASREALLSIALVVPALLTGMLPLIAADGAEAASVHHVHIDGFTMDPPSLTIDEGDTVEWHNHDSVSHTASEGSPGGSAPAWTTGFLSSGASTQITFDDAGAYTYYCEVHPGSMTGYELIVEGPPPDPAPDLDVSGLVAGESDVGQEVTITTTVTNVGELASPASSLELTAQGAQAPENIGTLTVPALDAGESVTLITLWETTGKVGAYTITAVADPDDAIQETREANNARETQVCLPEAAGLTCHVDGRDLIGL